MRTAEQHTPASHSTLIWAAGIARRRAGRCQIFAAVRAPLTFEIVRIDDLLWDATIVAAGKLVASGRHPSAAAAISWCETHPIQAAFPQPRSARR